MNKLMREEVFLALHKGIHEASAILPTCKTRQERTLLLGFITHALEHMAKLKSAEHEIAGQADMCAGDIELRRLIDSERIIRDLEEKSKISTVADLINIKEPQMFEVAVESDSLESADDLVSDDRAYANTLFIRKVILAMCPRGLSR